MTKEDAFKLGLPKWPQCCISGKKLTPEQALEIIRRTDSFFTHNSSGNNQEFIKEARKITRCPDLWGDKRDWEILEAELEEFKKKWQTVKTEYILNSWISCSFIGGPHGWCHPDGTIYFDDNIGKWPTVEEVYNDLEILAKEFPFVEMTVTLMDREDGELDAQSVVSMFVKDGKVEIIDTIPAYIARHHEKDHSDLSGLFKVLSGHEGEISLAQLKEWANKVYGE